MRWLSSLALILVALATTACGAGTLTLAHNGQSPYRIVVPEDPKPAVQSAAQALAEFLSRVTGASWPIATTASGHPAIRLRRTPQTATNAPDAYEAYKLSVQGEDLIITGNSGRALFYAVHRFLELHVGVHWFTPGNPTVPTRPDLAVHVQPGWRQPRFAYREVFFRHADNPLFAARNRLNGRFGHRLGKRIPEKWGGDRVIRKLHIFELVPPEEYADSHPGWFVAGQLRFSSAAVQRAAKQHLRAYLAKWDESPAYILIEHADRNTYFHGGKDGRLIERFGAPSAAYVDFVRALARMIQQSHPEVTVLAQAYLWSREPPEDMNLPPNMGVMISCIKCDLSQPFTAPVNQDFLNDLDGWGQLTSHVIVWLYVTNFAGYIQPFPDIHTYAPNLRALARRDFVEGIFAQGAYQTKGAALAKLRTWLLARLMWDPTRDVDALIHTFMTGYFGPAAPYISAYLDALTAAAKRWPGKLRAKTPPTAGYLDAQFLRRADRLLAKAEQAVAGQPVYLRRVQTLRIAVDYAVLTNRAELRAKGEGEWINAERRLARLERYLEQAGVRVYREGGGASIDNLLQSLAIDRTGSQPPALCADRPDDACRVVKDLGLHLVGGGARLVADPAAADGAAAMMPGDAHAWGIQLPLGQLLPKQGQWHIYVRARAEIEGGKEKAVPAFQVGVYPGTQHTVTAAPGAGYRLLRVPGTYTRAHGGYLWFAPSHAPRVARFYIDRVIAVRVEDGG